MMATNAMTKTEPGADLLEKVLVGGDLAKLTAAQRLTLYEQVCASLGLNQLTRPFEYITLQGKLTLYARKDATDQLRKLHRVSVSIVSQEPVGDLYVVKARATMPDGRSDEEIGVVPIAGLRGDALANALMKATTKSKRRVTLSVCGLGFLDESELETIPPAEVQRAAVGAAPAARALPAAPAAAQQPAKRYTRGELHKLCVERHEEAIALGLDPEEPPSDEADIPVLMAYGTRLREAIRLAQAELEAHYAAQGTGETPAVAEAAQVPAWPGAVG